MATSTTDLRADSLFVTPQDRDWSEGFPDTWDVAEAPDCQQCGDTARWDNEAFEWKCEEHGTILDAYTDGPMMNYAYPLPSLGKAGDEYEAASLLGGLPLCIVRYFDHRDFELALTGGGMDLSWEICEAFIRLGFLPPVHFCDLPRMAGRGESERDKEIIAACRRSLGIAEGQIVRRRERLDGLGGGA